MNIELIQRNILPPDKEKANGLAQKTGLHIKLCELLISRGFDTAEAVKKFLEPSLDDFHDPLLMAGMKEAVERINQAIENGEKIVVYGDYDADGICAAAILSLYLSSRGLNIYTHIPSRITDGYGLSIETLEKIIENVCPDLILTCDCGISAHEEIEFALDLGVDVIVTDHHEIAGEIPGCIAVNPKRRDCAYPIDYLCGAGVALKLVEALGGIEAAAEFFDLAAVATIADLVPLLDENRLIVQLGLKNIKNIGLKSLIRNQQIENAATSSDIAYKIAPRINAAGRMGDAYRAFELLISKDTQKINAIISDINEDNQKRKSLCDELYDEAVGDIKSENLINNRAIILCHPAWEKGITGILAARLAGDFKRPSFVLVGAGEVYKGTSRSVRDINIYELLTSVSDILEEFGGHSQAAGFSIKEQNIPEFKKRVNEYLLRFDESCFLPSCEYDLEINVEEIDKTLCKSLELLEPVGNSNLRPVFMTRVDKLDVSVCKSNYNHTNIVSGNLNIIAFNFYNENQFLLGDSEKNLAIELQLNTFNYKESARAVLRAVSPSELFISDTTARAAFLKYIEKIPAFYSNKAEFSSYTATEFDNFFNAPAFGTLIIAGCEASYNRVKNKAGAKKFLHEFLYPTTKNNLSRIMVSPLIDDIVMLSNYNRIIFMDSPIGSGIISYLNSKTSAQIFIPEDSNETEFLKTIDLSRDMFLRYFDAIKKNPGLSALNIFSYFKILSARVSGLELNQFIACWHIFSELNFIQSGNDGFSPSINSGAKSELTNSLIYQYIKERVN